MDDANATTDKATHSPDALYTTSGDALKSLKDAYDYWTGRLTDTSVQLSYAILAANWAVFGSLHAVLSNWWSKSSIVITVLGMGVNLLATRWMGEGYRKRIGYAQADLKRWEAEFQESLPKNDSFPSTVFLDTLAERMRWIKAWCPILAGVLFLVGVALYR